ncbi:hypothetical protein KA005_00905, partial [bacterium]|nr:hypothetical protein [bacterium]
MSIAFSGLVAFKLNDSQKVKAGIKSFAVFRIVGGFLLIGFLLIYTAAGTFNLITLVEDTTWLVTLNDNGTLLLTTICVLIGIFTKLAQFPFHFWLPDATTAVPPEVNAFAKASLGIYLPVRLVPIFYAGIENGLTGLTIFFYSLTLIALISGLIAAGLILIQQDVWKALAYYFMSQYARMLIGLGVSGISLNPSLGYTGAIVHLVTDSVVVVAFVLGLTVNRSLSHRNSLTGSLKESLSTSKSSKYMNLVLLVLIGLPPFCIFWSEETLTTAVWTLFLSALNRNQLPLAWFSGGVYLSMLIILALISFGLLRISGLIKIRPNTSTLPVSDENEKPVPVFLKGLALGSAVMIILISVITPLIILYLENATGTFFHLETHSVSIVVFIYT